MAKKEDNIQSTDAAISNDVANVEIAKEVEHHGKVICVCNGFAIVEDELGNGFISYDSNLKIGDII